MYDMSRSISRSYMDSYTKEQREQIKVFLAEQRYRDVRSGTYKKEPHEISFDAEGNREKAGHTVGAVIIQIGLMLCFPASPRAVFFLSNAKKVSVQLPFEVRTAIFLFSKNYTCPHFPQSEHPLQISRLPHSLQLSR